MTPSTDTTTAYTTSDFSYDLPAELIAQSPLPQRCASRLLQLDAAQTGGLTDGHFTDLPTLLQAGDLLVLNDTQVLPARIYGRKQTGGALELLLERMLSPTTALFHIKASKAPAVGSWIELLPLAAEIPRSDAITHPATTHLATTHTAALPAVTNTPFPVQIIGRQGSLYQIDCQTAMLEVLQQYGQQPLPPYITRTPDAEDQARYQTVYARSPGAVAAPTAGLHFDAELLETLQQRGVEIGYVTLHVAAGTFQPVRGECLQQHVMHREYMQLDQSLCAQVQRAKASGKRVVAVGTTVVRCLEQAALTASQAQGTTQACDIRPYTGDTQLFIYPGKPGGDDGFQFRCVDALLTNFHLPRSSLMMLVAAFAGYERIMQAYQHAVASRYRFFSYGDAMWLTRACRPV